MKKIVFFLILVSFVMVGCAKKSATEQLKDDMNKAAKKLDKEVQGLLN